MINLSSLDYTIIILFFTIVLAIGIYVSKKSGKNSEEFFLSGRNMPWWLLGLSMVATTFSTDTPNLVTDIVRKKRSLWKLGLVGFSNNRFTNSICLR